MAYRAENEQSVHQYSISKDEPMFLQARANAANLSEVRSEGWAVDGLCVLRETWAQQTHWSHDFVLSTEVTLSGHHIGRACPCQVVAGKTVFPGMS